MTPGSRALVFGASGAIGDAIGNALEAEYSEVLRAGRSGGRGMLAVQPPDLQALDDLPVLDAVVWAHGTNLNDSAADVDVGAYEELMAGNVTYVVATLGHLLRGARIARGGRLVVLSSIWETLARPDKFSYTISKAAIGGLIRAASADLASHGILVNAVLPSVTDTPMTRAMLDEAQVEAVAGQTSFRRLVTVDEVAGVVVQLCSPRNTAVTGQSIAVDLGFSHVRHL